jgi:hypothetical protein
VFGVILGRLFQRNFNLMTAILLIDFVMLVPGVVEGVLVSSGGEVPFVHAVKFNNTRPPEAETGAEDDIYCLFTIQSVTFF